MSALTILVTGIELWRTNVSSPTTAAQFSQIGGDGLGIVPIQYIRNFSYLSIQGTGSDSGSYYLYVSAGDNSQPLAIFRQKNN